MKVRMKLSLLAGGSARRDNAELASLEIETWARQNLSVAIGDHPRVEGRVKIGDIATKQLIGRTVNRGAGYLALSLPVDGMTRRGSVIPDRRSSSRRHPPYASGVQCARESSEQV